MVEVPISFSFGFGYGSFGAAIPLQHREAQPQPAMHSCYFRSSNESLYQSQLGGLNSLPQTGFEHPVFGVGSERQYQYTTRQLNLWKILSIEFFVSYQRFSVQNEKFCANLAKVLKINAPNIV